jgi:endonuclease-8
VLRALGPDVLAEDFDPAVAASRARPDMELGDVLLDQTIAAGAGNVYKSETLFVAGLDPFRPVGSLADGELVALYMTLASLMRRNLHGVNRVTTSGGVRSAHWVYDRTGRPCLRCGEIVRSRRQGPDARMTYWCPRCQR